MFTTASVRDLQRRVAILEKRYDDLSGKLLSVELRLMATTEFIKLRKNTKNRTVKTSTVCTVCDKKCKNLISLGLHKRRTHGIISPITLKNAAYARIRNTFGK